MKPYFTTASCMALILVAITGVGQTLKEKELKTEIKEVTVFLQGAQIFESGTVSIPPGKTLLRVRNLSPWMDEKSIRVKADGDFVILSVNHKLNHLKSLKKESVIDSLNEAFQKLGSAIEFDNAHLAVLKEKLSLMNENKKLGGQNTSISLAQLKQAIDFYDAEVTRIKEDEIRTSNSIASKRERQTIIQSQVKELNAEKTLPSGEIEIEIDAKEAGTGNFAISYIVAKAGWYPKYDVRVENVKSPLTLTYKAEVYQNTGVDWKNVRLRFSNADIKQTGLVPQLNKWSLNFARYAYLSPAIYGSRAAQVGPVTGVVTDENGEPLAGVNVLVKGTTNGTTTDVNGRYSITVPQYGATIVYSFIGYQSIETSALSSEINQRLSADTMALNEVVANGYTTSKGLTGGASNIRIRGTSTLRQDAVYIPTTNVAERQTTFEFEIQTPYSIKSNGEKLKVDLKSYDIDASYEYYSVPKLDKDAFLIARIINWDQYNLLEGEANLYFEDAFVGRSVLDAKSMRDTLEISLGRDKSIVITRERKEQMLKKQVLGSNITDTRTFAINVRNKKSQPVKVTVFDQLPVTLVDDIVVEAKQLTNGRVQSDTGEVKWEFTLEPQQQKELLFEYEVKYPKRESVILE